MVIASEMFGTYRETPVQAFMIANRRGMRVRIMCYGACLLSFEVPDAKGRFKDVVLGFDDLKSYLADPAYFGMTCGRMVNRIRNAEFELDGKTYKLTRNWRRHQLHGGIESFSRRIWDAETDELGNAVTFSLTSPDGEEGYPGTVKARTTYALDDHGLTITMSAETDKPTVVNQAHHSYWNLAGHDAGRIDEHIVSVEADSYTPGDEDLIPTGTIEPVADTPFDLRKPRSLSQHFATLKREGEHNGFDGNWCVNGKPGMLRLAATLTDPASGRSARFLTTEPGIQVYTAGWLAAGTKGKGGAVYGPYDGIAFEPQIYPDAPNVATFPSARLDPGTTRVQVMRVEFP